MTSKFVNVLFKNPRFVNVLLPKRAKLAVFGHFFGRSLRGTGLIIRLKNRLVNVKYVDSNVLFDEYVDTIFQGFQ